jgi:hypothetical protein
MVSNFIRACSSASACYPSKNKTNPEYYVRRGNLGHMFQILNKIVTLSQTDPNFKTLLDNIPEWPAFLQETLVPLNSTWTREWGGSGESVAALIAQKVQRALNTDFTQFKVDETVAKPVQQYAAIQSPQYNTPVMANNQQYVYAADPMAGALYQTVMAQPEEDPTQQLRKSISEQALQY